MVVQGPTAPRRRTSAHDMLAELQRQHPTSHQSDSDDEGAVDLDEVMTSLPLPPLGKPPQSGQSPPPANNQQRRSSTGSRIVPDPKALRRRTVRSPASHDKLAAFMAKMVAMEPTPTTADESDSDDDEGGAFDLDEVLKSLPPPPLGNPPPSFRARSGPSLPTATNYPTSKEDRLTKSIRDVTRIADVER